MALALTFAVLLGAAFLIAMAFGFSISFALGLGLPMVLPLAELFGDRVLVVILAID